MKTYRHWVGAAACVLVLALCASTQSSGVVPGLEKALANISIRHMDRTVLGEDVVDYRFDVVVGPGKFDVIRLHRIVREKHPYQPIHTVGAVLLLPGAPNTFEMIFMEPLISELPAWDQSVTAFLAKNNVDVWGMDYAWALVPGSTTNFKFMKNWGIKKDAQHTEAALSLARWIRGLTGQGFGRINLLGFSWGTTVAYTLAGDETQLPHSLRNVKGLIPVDNDMGLDRSDPVAEALRLVACDAAAASKAQLDAGTYSWDAGVFLIQVGDLARSKPDDPSPFADGLTNYQFALFVGAGSGPPIYDHFVGGYFDNSGIPIGLRYTDPLLWIDALRAVPPFVPLRALYELQAVSCGDIQSPLVEHLGDIALPILYVGSAGSEGTYGYYTLTLTASTDITKFTVQLLPDDQRALDFGHADLFMAKDAPTLVWKPILDWLVAHK